jgi:hypothetical protein
LAVEGRPRGHTTAAFEDPTTTGTPLFIFNSQLALLLSHAQCCLQNFHQVVPVCLGEVLNGLRMGLTGMSQRDHRVCCLALERTTFFVVLLTHGLLEVIEGCLRSHLMFSLR